MENNYIVYMHISPNNKRYIGLTCQKPEYRWNNGKGYKHNEYFTNAINKYGWDNFEHIIIAKGLTEDEAKWLEIELIREWDTTNPNKGYNITKGGEGANGLVHTEEFKEKQSERYSGEGNPFYGKQHTEETRRKISENHADFNGENSPRYGKKASEETRRKISENHADFNGEKHPMFGKHHTKETKEKISKANSGANNGKARKIILLNTKEIFNTITEGAKKYNVNYDGLCACCLHYQKSAGKHPITGEKLIWMYYNEYLENTLIE